MSCTKCDNQADVTYLRVGNANVLIVGCKSHLAELIRIYKRGMKAEEVEDELQSNG